MGIDLLKLFLYPKRCVCFLYSSEMTDGWQALGGFRMRPFHLSDQGVFRGLEVSVPFLTSGNGKELGDELIISGQ